MTTRFDEVFDALKTAPRLLVQADLRPVQGDRFQPTGFPDLGAATYKRPDGTPMLLVESAQSMANHMEKICWDDATDSIQLVLEGLPYVEVDLGENGKTTSLQEPHRLASLYILNSSRSGDSQKFYKTIISEAQMKKDSSINVGKLAQTVFKYDPNSILHGLFLARSDMGGGRGRLQRLLSGFIEARGVHPVQHGGTLMQHVDPKGDDAYSRFTGTGENKEENTSITKAIDTAGNVPFPLTEYIAKETVAYFNLDLATLRGYRLGDAAERLLIALSLYKILRLLNGNLKLRTRCDFDVLSLTVTRPNDVSPLNYAELLYEIEAALPQLIATCKFVDEPITRLVAPPRDPKKTSRKEGRKGAGKGSAVTTDTEPDDDDISEDEGDEDA